MKKSRTVIILSVVAALILVVVLLLTREPAPAAPSEVPPTAEVSMTTPAPTPAPTPVAVPTTNPDAAVTTTQTTDASGNRIVTVTHPDGTSTTITIVNVPEGGSGVRSEDDPAFPSPTPTAGDEPTPTPAPTSPPATGATAYEQYCAMSPEEQYAVFLTFESPEAFMAWYNAIKAEYDAAHPAIVINPGDVINFGT